MWIISLFIIILFFILSFFFSGIETGLISVDRLKLEQEAKSNKKKKQILDFLENPDQIFGTTLFGTNISLVVVSSLSIFLINIFNKKSVINISEHTATLIIAGFILVFAEIIPKALYRDFPNRFVSSGFPLLRFFSFIFTPFVKFVSLLNNALAKLFKLPQQSRYNFVSREDLSFMLSEAKDDGVLHEDQMDMLEDALEFSELDAENVMIHRTDVMAFPLNTPIEEVISIAKEKGFTRFPVYENNLDNIKGILIIYDLLKQKDHADLTAADFIRNALFAPETMDVNKLLTEMQKEKVSMAIIMDSYGGTAGVITIEDILEEIVGEIEDEYDNTTQEISEISSGLYRVQSYAEIDFLNDEYDMVLPLGDYETIAGMIIDKLERIPRGDTQLTIGNWDITIIQATDNRIITVEMRKVEEQINL
ncbi:MAG: hemolysin family protein [Candidatus Cloacimonetes bacterium]|jgi:CBS domain containing-hemolysin-like protein|nr:hemolysin family protein [Candidatus Cloacimonadota bacterium]